MTISICIKCNGVYRSAVKGLVRCRCGGTVFVKATPEVEAADAALTKAIGRADSRRWYVGEEVYPTDARDVLFKNVSDNVPDHQARSASVWCSDPESRTITFEIDSAQENPEDNPGEDDAKTVVFEWDSLRGHFINEDDSSDALAWAYV